MAGMKVAHRKSYRQNGSLFGSDRRFFAISHPDHYDRAAEHAWILPFVPLCFTLEMIDWLVAVAHELYVSIDERPQQSRLLM